MFTIFLAALTLGVGLQGRKGVLSAPAHKSAVYDQRQHGNVNVQVDLKDVQVIALIESDMFDDYMNYDYAYDYNDFTIKPVTRTSTVATTSIKPWSTWPTNSPSNSSSTTSTPETSSMPPSLSSNTSSTMQPANSSPASSEMLTTTLGAVTTEKNNIFIKTSFSSSLNGGHLNSDDVVASSSVVVITNDSSDTKTNSYGRTRLNNKFATALQGKNLNDGTSTDGTSTTPSPNTEFRATKVLRKRCPPGFAPKSGRCFHRRTTFPFMMKLASIGSKETEGARQ